MVRWPKLWNCSWMTSFFLQQSRVLHIFHCRFWSHACGLQQQQVLRVKKVHFFPLDIRHESCLKMHPCSSTPARPFFARFTCIMMNYAIVGRKSTVPKKDAHLPTFSKKGCLIDMREACPFWVEFFRAFYQKIIRLRMYFLRRWCSSLLCHL